MNDEQTNEEIEKIAGMMMGDGISPDEQDHAVLEKYQAQIEQDCGVGSEDSAKILYETLLYLKMKGTKSGDFLEKGNEFGAGFS